MCHYTQDSDDDFDWTQRYGGTPSGNTGPEVDHTTSRMGESFHFHGILFSRNSLKLASELDL